MVVCYRIVKSETEFKLSYLELYCVGRTIQCCITIAESTNNLKPIVYKYNRMKTRNTTTFRYIILCILTLVTRKLQVVCWRSRYAMTPLLSEMSIFCVRGGWQILMVRYASNVHRSLFPISYFCIYSVLRHINLKTQVICGSLAYRTTAILLETFFLWFKVALEIQLESYGPRHTPVIFWCDIVCVYCKSVYTSLFGLQLCLTTKLMYVMTAYIMTAYMYYPPNANLIGSVRS